MLELATPSNTVQSGIVTPSIVSGIPGDTSAADAPGRRRVFTGDWLTGGCGCHIYSEGYLGELVRRWNGWAVFRVTHDVAAAIVAQQQRTVHQEMIAAMGAGARASDAWLGTLASMPSVFWVQNIIVVDSRVGFADPTMAEVTTPDSGGCYTIGWGWMWDDTDAGDVHTVHGAGAQ